MATPVYLFISPHLDDVVLSCGGYVSRLTASGVRVVIVTVVTADAPNGTQFSWLMQRNHRAWHLGNAPFEQRRSEDTAAVLTLKAEFAHLGLLDAMYRLDAAGMPLYIKNTVRVPIHPDDWKNFAPTVSRELQRVSDAFAESEVRFVCPLSAGEHIDHILVRHTIESMIEPERIMYYEDYPYADQANAVQARLNLNSDATTWESIAIELTPEEIEMRLAAIACYESQIPGLFPSTLERWKEIACARLPFLERYLNGQPDCQRARARMESLLGAYITRAHGERYWRHCKSREQVT